MKKAKSKSAAVVTIFAAPEMTSEGRKNVVKWLRQQARFLEKYGPELAARFTARYLYPDDAQ